jgi:hypothetical protein
VACIVAFTLGTPALAQQTAAPSLYKRLGGCDTLAAVTDDFLARLSADPGFGRFFAGHSTDSTNGFASTLSISSARRPAAPASTPGAT